MSKKIVLTGGGTAGHVTPNLALLPRLREQGYEVFYIGSYAGIEKELVADFDIPYYGIATGKFRRYFDPKNFSDPFRVLKGISEAKNHLREIRPDIVFSKGGFVSVPVVRAAASLGIPCIVHESDMTPGLANKICMRVASKICCTFPETLKHLPQDKAVLTGSPIREELLHGNPEEARALCGFEKEKPVLMVVGGSLGSAAINQAVRDALPDLLPDFQIVHICGRDKVDNMLLSTKGYTQFEYLTTEMKDIFALASLVISRAGANSISELLALKKPNLLIPLPAGSSRGDQILNASSFEAQGFSMVINEDDLTGKLLVEKVQELYFKRSSYVDAMNKSPQRDAVSVIASLIDKTARPYAGKK